MKKYQSVEEIHDLIRSWILENKLEPGKKINQNEIAKGLKVSRTPVVKALHKLATEGLVDTVFQKGFFVHQITIKELYEVFLLREAMEKIVISEIADKLTHKNIKELEIIFAEFKSQSNIDVKKYAVKDQHFHTKLLEFSSNELVKKINDSYQILNRTFVCGLVRPPEETLPEHLKIIEALKNKDVEQAIKIIGDHDSKTHKKILRLMKDLSELKIYDSRTQVENIPNKNK